MDKKKLFRKSCIEELKNISDAQRYINSKLVVSRLESVIEKCKVSSVLLYMPFGFEVNIKKLLYKYKKDNSKKILLPFIEEESFKMVQYKLPMRRNSFGILEPTNSLKDEKNVDMIVVPVVGVDGNMKRVGFGKGMYDRFYEKLKSKPLVVFIQIKKCFTSEKICNSYDISCNYYITPKETLYIGKRDDTGDYLGRSGSIHRRITRLFKCKKNSQCKYQSLHRTGKSKS